ncbi:hypothetical protein UFOVP67_15 [uncultured Caudovirales phage]|uniref:Uncharacterized protein n=1 Tax=uncultured Caudovirales phage TaxID=2100421 RepID=A0A6J5T907_9CAUD|nr:hypothetical protein UFOVP67_15 [uncultured Caudovirales phage]
MRGLMFPPPPTQDKTLESIRWQDWFTRIQQTFNGILSLITFSDLTLPVVANNQFFGGPATGTSGVAGFRLLENPDIPDVLVNKTLQDGAVLDCAVAATSFGTSIRTVTIDTTVSVNDRTILVDCSSGDIVITLPDATAVTGLTILVKKIAGGILDDMTLQPTLSQTIDGASNYTVSSNYSFVEVQSNGVQWWIINK